MTVSALSLGGSLRRRIGVLAASALVLPLALIAVATPSASATNPGFLPETSFAIDGDSYGPNDFDAPYGPGTTPGGYPTTGLYYVHRTIDMGGTSGCAVPSDDAAEGGTKIQDGPLWPIGAHTEPNGKTDIDWLDMAAEKVDVNGQINDILYVGYQKCGGNGTWQTMLYLDDGDGIVPSLGDLNGDYLFIFDFDPSDNSVTILMHRRIDGVWVQQAMPADAIQGFASSAPDQQDPAPDPQQGNYGEVAINLTRLEIIPQDTCRTTNVSGQSASITGGDLSSAVKDLIDVTPVEISNCGALTVNKVSSPAGITVPDLFHYYVDQGAAKDAADLDVVHDSTLAVTRTGGGMTDEPDSIFTELDSQITIGGVHNWTNVISQPDYRIVEDVIPTPWKLKEITCTYADIFTVGHPTVTTTMYTNGAYTSSEFLIPPSTLGGTALAPASCTITNAATGLVLNKVVVNDSHGTATGSEFTLTATLTNPPEGLASVLTGPDPAPNDASVGLAGAVLPGTFELSETIGVKGYIGSLWTCVVTAADGTVGSPLVGVSSVTIPEFGGANCTITNDDPPSLAWTKVDSMTGDLLGGTSWILTREGQGLGLDVQDCIAGPCSGPDQDADPGEFLVLGLAQGTYTLTEFGAPAGYQTNTTTYTITIDTNGAFTLTPAIPNVPTAVAWTKVGADGMPLAGTTWAIWPGGDSTAAIEVTDCVAADAAACAGPDKDPEAGAFKVYRLPAGPHTLVETAVPAGYYLPPATTTYPFTVDPSFHGTILVTEGAFTNKLVKTTWQKVDEFDPELLLAGSSWELYGPDDQFMIVTDCLAAAAAECAGPDVDPALGTFAVLGLAPGDWTLIERDPPVGYLIIADPITLTITSGQEVFDFGAIENYQNGRMTWVKKDDAGAILGGATFEICEVVDAEQEPECIAVEDYTGQEDYDGWDEDERPGYFYVADLIFGDFTVTETAAPDGYLMDETVHEVTVLASEDPADAGVFVNIKKVYGLTLTKAAYEAVGEGLDPTDGTVDFGDTVSYELDVTATGNAPQTNVTVTDVLPAGVTYVEGSATCLDEVSACTATYDAATRTVTMVVAEMLPGTTVLLVFEVNVDAAPEVAPGTTYSWQGDNVGAAVSTETPTEVPSNVVTVKASKTVLPATGSESGPLVLFALLAILMGGGLVVLTRRRAKHTTR